MVDATQLPDMRSDWSAPTLTEDAPDASDMPPASPATVSPDPHDTPPEREPLPSVARDRWVTREELLASSEHAIYGARSPYARRADQPLPRPERFRAVPKWQSWGALIVATTITLGVVVGAVIFSHIGANLFSPSAPVTPTAIQQPTVTPAAISK